MHPTKIYLYIVSEILLIVPIVDFALAAPVLVQEKRQAHIDMLEMPSNPITVLGKRAGMGKYLEDWVVPPVESSAAHESSSPAPLEMSVMNAPAPNPGPLTESEHSLAGMDAPLSSPVYPAWFHPDNELLGAHPPQPNTGPSNPSTELDSGPRLVAEEPPPRVKPSLSKSHIEMGIIPPKPKVVYGPDRESMRAVSIGETSTDSDVLQGQAKESRRNSGTARDVLDTAQSELQRERSLDPGE
jgi:hypothetical protein